MKGLFVIALGFFALVGCSNQQAYNSLQGARENECRQIADANERDSCFENARKSYDQYEQQRKESRNP